MCLATCFVGTFLWLKPCAANMARVRGKSRPVLSFMNCLASDDGKHESGRLQAGETMKSEHFNISAALLYGNSSSTILMQPFSHAPRSAQEPLAFGSGASSKSLTISSWPPSTAHRSA